MAHVHLGAEVGGIGNLFADYGIYGIFISIALENLGIPFPTEAAYIYSCVLISKGSPYWLLLTVLTAAHLVGSIIAYALGYWGEVFLAHRFSKNQKFVRTSEWLHRWYSRYGALTVFATRFVGYVRPWSSFIAGFAQINFLVFVVWTLFGSFMFNIFLLGLTVRLMDIWYEVHGYLRVLMVVGFIISCSLVYLLKIMWDRHHHRLSSKPEEPPGGD